MIGQNSNNRASGISAKECDAGIPISGRTSDTGVYNILKINPDGSLPISGGGAIPIPDSTTPYLLQPALNPIPIGGALAPNTFLCLQQITGLINEGVYRVNPGVIYDGAVAGSINMAIIKQSSTMGGYFAGLVPFVDPVAPTTGNIFLGGFAYYWHNTNIVGLGANVVMAYNRSNTQTMFLEAADYFLVVWNDNGVVLTPGGNLVVGAIEFSKV